MQFHHYQSIPHFKIHLDINFYWNRRPLTISRFCWWPFWKRWHRTNDPEWNGPHYQSKLSTVSDLNENWYLGVFWNEELVGNDGSFIHMPELLYNNPRYQFSLKSENTEILPILSPAILKIAAIWSRICLVRILYQLYLLYMRWSFGDFYVCIQTQSNLVNIILPLFLLTVKLPYQILRNWISDLY
jgi:hypothetical protein